MEIERVERMGNETEEREIEGVDSENEGVDNKVLPSKRKLYSLSNKGGYFF